MAGTAQEDSCAVKRVLDKAGDDEAEVIRMVLGDSKAHRSASAARGIAALTGRRISPASVYDHRHAACPCKGDQE